MSTSSNKTGNNRDAGVVEEICNYLTAVPPRSYFLFAGAGSGKTRTLVEVLRRMTGVVEHKEGGHFAKRLKMYGRSIRVITYTKNAVSVINNRLGNNELVDVSTIHAFCWELINGFNDDIRAALVAIKEDQFEKTREEALSKPKGLTPAKQKDLDSLSEEIEELKNTDLFIYHPDRMTYGRGALAHDHVLAATAWLLNNRPTLASILKDRHPIILIDESQDTIKGMLEALMDISESIENGLTLGLIGDHRQRIYTNGHADLPSLVPTNWEKPKLEMNHRSQRRIVELINTIWEAKLEGRTQPAIGVKQHSRSEKSGGFARIFVGDTNLSPEDKVLGEFWCANRMFKETGIEAWSQNDFQLLALEHKLVAARGSFLDVFSAMNLLDKNAAAPSGSGENKGPSIVQVLLNELIDLENCINLDGSMDEFKVTEVFRRYESFDKDLENPIERSDRIEVILRALKAFAKACKGPNSTVREVLEPILKANLFNIDSRLAEEHANTSPPPIAPKRGTDESKQDRLRRGLCALFSAPWSQLKKYRDYLSGNSTLATHQVVKGSEFPHVMVVMDDKLAGGTQFNYDKVFGGSNLTDRDNKNKKEGKETSIDRTLRLLYVTCSRAEESLALVLWSSNPAAAKEKIKESGWFSGEEVQSIKK